MQYTYDYWTEPINPPHSNPWVEHSRIKEIRYNYTQEATNPLVRLTGSPLSKIVFTLTSDRRIDYIDLYHIDLANRYRRIDLELGSVTPPDYCGRNYDPYTKVVWSIREYNSNGSAALPPTTFGYTALANYTDGGRWCDAYLRLQTVNNGRGGTTRFTYGLGDGRWQPFVGDGTPAWGQTYLVTQRETWDGIHTTPSVTQYSYNKPCYDQYDDGGYMGALPGAFNCPTRSNNGAYGHGNLVGFYESWVTFKDYDGSELSREYNRFSQDRWTMGYPTLQQTLDAYQRVKTGTSTTYTTINVAGGITKYSYASKVETTSYQPQSRTSRVEYVHNEYGNQTLVKMHGDISLVDGERRTESEYHNVTNTGNGLWLIGLPRHTRVYSGLSGGALLNETRYAYDYLAYGATPTKGLLTKTGTGLQGTLWPETQLSYTSPFDLLTQEIDPNNNSSTATYEMTYYLYPIQGCNALGQCSSAAYYGVGGVPADYGLRGQVKSITDPNGVQMQYQYDSFGRLVKVLQPPDINWSYPTSAYQYYDWSGFPTFYLAEQREEIGLAGTLQARAYQDGLGRAVQSLAEDDTGAGWASTYQRYNALGQVAEAYTPVEKGAAFSMYEAEGTSYYHACGSSTSGGWLSPAVGSGVCHMTYGPYHAPAEVGPGQVARFRLSVDVTFGMSNDVVAVIRVHDQTTNEWIAGRNVYRLDFSGGLNHFTDLTLEFDTTGRGGHQLQYVVTWQNVAQMAHDNTIIAWKPQGPRTLSRYDALGNPVRVTQPDGAQQIGVYGARVALSQDANRHIKLSRTDAFGQLSAVEETLVPYRDEFSDGSVAGWTTAGTVVETGGVMRITGNGAWGTEAMQQIGNLASGVQGVIVSFKWDRTNAIGHPVYATTGVWGQSAYRGWGLTVNNGVLKKIAYVGTTPTETNLLTLQANVWYRCLLRLGGANGEFIVAVWEQNNPAISAWYIETKDSSWGGTWDFHAAPHTGVLEIQRYDELTFHSTSYAYDLLGNLTNVTDAVGNQTQMQYDALGRKKQMSDPDMGVWYYTYDNAGNLKSQVDAKLQAINFYYDPLNRLKGKTYNTGPVSLPYARPEPDPGYGGYAVKYRYDESGYGASIGRRTRMEDGSGSTSWTYDVRGRVTQESKTISGGGTFVTAYTYDDLNRVKTMTYPDGEVVNTAYNTQGLPQSLSGSNTYVSAAGYNAAGQPTALTLGNTVKTNYLYDAQRMRLLHLQVGPQGSLLDMSYSYDPAGNVTRLNDRRTFTLSDPFDTKSSNWTWNSYQSVYSDGGNNVIKNSGTGSSYDANFYRSTYSLSDGKGMRLRFKVDQADAMAHFSIEANDATNRRFGMIANGGKLYVQYADNGSNWTYPADLLASFQLNTWYVMQIVVDDSGNGFIIEVYKESDPSVQGSYRVRMPGGKQWRFHHWIYRGNAYLDDYREFNEGNRFTYDALDRLTRAWTAGSDVAPYDRSYTYNTIGNLMSKAGVSYTYPTVPGQPRPHAVTALSDGSTYTYDANGNMTTRVEGGVTYNQTFDIENRLVSVTASGQTTTFTYDGDGRRVKKVDASGTTYTPGEHYEVKGGVVTKYYYLGGQRVAMKVGSTVYWLHGDHLGSTSLTTNSSGSVYAQQRYFPYGEVRWSSGSLPTDRQYTGQRRETSLGIYDYKARFYSPYLGRFLSADTLVPGVGSQALNRYMYVEGSP